MKKTLLLFGMAGVLMGQAYAQPKTQADVAKASDEEVVRLIADHILEQPVTQFVGVSDGKVYDSTKDIPKGEDVRFKSPLMEWHYSSGVTNMAIIKLGQYLNEQKYVDYALNHVAFGFDNYAYFKKTFRGDRKHWHWPFGQLWNFKELDDCGAMGASVIDVNQIKPSKQYQEYIKNSANHILNGQDRLEDGTLWNFKELDDCGAMGASVIDVNAINPEKEYQEYIKNAANHVLNGQDRLEDGTLCRTFPREMTVWADDLYMSVSFLSRMGTYSGESKYWDDAIHQITKMDEYLWDPVKQLYYHCWYSDLERNGVAYWGRANGWITFAISDLLDVLPEDYPGRDKLIAILEKQIVGFSRYQDADGMWKQLLDKPDSYQETSVTALFVYGIAKAVNQGWIDPAYGRIALRGWNALKKDHITPEGKFINVCVGTGISDDLVFYYTRPVGDNEKHGLGLVLNAGLEMMKMNEK